MNSSNNSKPPTTMRRLRNNRKVATAPMTQEEGASSPQKSHKMCHSQQRKNAKCSTPRRNGRPTNKNKSNNKSPRSQKRKQQRINNNNAAALSQEEQARYVGLDCEMVGVGPEGITSALARVVLVDYNGNILLDKFVKVEQPVTDYRTFVSGITSNDLQSTDAISYDECRSIVATMLRKKILVGHALKNDLQVLGIRHPWQDVRDTAKYEPFMKTRTGFDDGKLWPRRLRDLVQEKLNKTIQVEGKSHSPVEDAQSALELYKHARNKWEKVMEYKIKKTNEIMRKQQQQQQQTKEQQQPEQIAVAA